jgi:ribonucleoside-diphosphate reductase alpha chain
MSLPDIILKERYLQQGEQTWEDVAKRLARSVAMAEDSTKFDEWNQKFFDELKNFNFIPGGRIITNAGKSKPYLLNCNIISVDDSRESIGEMLKEILMISGTGGGVGLSFSKLRPKGTAITTNGGFSSGPISFMRCADQVAATIKTGGGRRAALMISLSVYHPDIEEFLHVKLDLGQLTNANISVEIDNKFIQAVKDDANWDLTWAGRIVKTVKAKEIWDKIITNAWKCGEPGIMNLGYMNEMSNSYYYSKIESTNPCGEIPGPAYASCDLGSINVSNFVRDGKFDRKAFEQTVEVGVRFLDNVLTINEYPLSKLKEVGTGDRRIGLGLCGLHYGMLKMGIKYSSEAGIEFTEKIYEILRNHSYFYSTELALEKGSFAKYEPEKFLKSAFVKTLPTKIREKIRKDGIRNVCLNTQAPTGTTSILANVSSGIEPIYAPVYERTFWSGDDKKKEIVADSLFDEMMNSGQDVSAFEGALEISPEQHIAIQEAAQRYLDQSISKTINLPKSYEVTELSDVVLKYIPRLKGITFYREGSRGDSPLKPLDINKYSKRNKTAEDTKEISCPSGVCSV